MVIIIVNDALYGGNKKKEKRKERNKKYIFNKFSYFLKEIKKNKIKIKPFKCFVWCSAEVALKLFFEIMFFSTVLSFI